MPNRFSAELPSPVISILLAACLTTGTFAQSSTQDYFAPLDELNDPFSSAAIGGQSFPRCCLQALKDWEQGNHQDITVYSNKDPTLPFTNPKALADSQQQFPCGAKYDDDVAGAATVFITYDYCSSRCGGWQRSKNKPLTQWIQPFVGFILPAAVFCLNVRTPIQD